MSLWQTMGQLCPPTPIFNEKNCPDQTGKGGYSGVGLELVKILYQKNATIYVAGRSESKAKAAIDDILSRFQTLTGKPIFLFVDLNDLTTVKPAVEEFLSSENRLDVLWNNAGVMFQPVGSTTMQGFEMQLGSNTVAPILLTKLLHPVLDRTAASAPPDLVRVCWDHSMRN
ncbi:hypothetical protein UA08_05112 [Talaromyces atroroseus]|uniref:Oxidoreductase n=1 Tax=Talaromyces atroroseus TaxID=1441469 RepID=A0A225AJH7_TALAT|nr:hypothetical protein UA08_05112 [Talaromyces atroroseus]OKL59513.1 hypothetical protein UA08_05112 [Talaromyces atroroseus]